METIRIKKCKQVRWPSRGSEQAAAWDLYMPEDVKVEHMALGKKVELGLKLEIPEGYYVRILPRSSTGKNTGIRLSNSEGVIDSDYRGEICALIDNLGEDITLDKGERYFQMILAKRIDAELFKTMELSTTERGEGGFGSSGK